MILHLQTDLSERGNLLEHMTHDKEELAKAEVELKELRTQNLILKEELEKVSQKLSIYSKVNTDNLFLSIVMSNTLHCAYCYILHSLP